MKHNLKKWGAVGFVVNAAVYLIAELVTAIGTGYPLDYVYRLQFISALGVYNGQMVEGVPLNFSPWAIVMNIGFILTAIGFFVSYRLLIYPTLRARSTWLARILLIIVGLFCAGSLLVGFFQGGVPGQAGWHGLGARLSFVMGNLTLLLTGVCLQEGKHWYRIISGLLAVMGFVAAYFLQMAILQHDASVMAIYERMTVYPITVWQLLTGILYSTHTTLEE